jgi:uncharacterized protein
MHRILVSILAILPCSTILAQEFTVAPPLVSTEGTAVIRVVPDVVDLSFEVEVRHADLAAARKDQAERSAKVLAALRAGGVAESELQSSQVQITPNYTNFQQETEKLRFFKVTQTISGILHDVKKVTDITAAAVSAGATGVRDATFRTSLSRKYRDDARLRALRAAREKATALATELGARVGKPYAIREASSYHSLAEGNVRLNDFQPAEAADDAAPSFALGTISISSTVHVSFFLE